MQIIKFIIGEQIINNNDSETKQNKYDFQVGFIKADESRKDYSTILHKWLQFQHKNNRQS